MNMGKLSSMKRFRRPALFLLGAVLILLIFSGGFFLYRSLKIHENNPLAHQRAGDAAMSSGNIAEARQEYEETLSLYREEGQSGQPYADALQRLAQIDTASGKQQKAADLLAQAAGDCGSFSPMWAWIIVHRAELLDSLGQKPAASRALDDARRRCLFFPGCDDLDKMILGLGSAEHLIAEGRPKQARAQLKTELASLKNNHGEFSRPAQCADAVSAASVAADLWERMGDWSMARQAGREGISASACAPQSAHALKLLVQTGKAEAACGRSDEAKALWQKALSSYQETGDSSGVQIVEYLLNRRTAPAPHISCSPD